MKKIFESDFNGFDESATKIHVYALESEKECKELDMMNWKDLCEYFNVYEEPEFAVAPGGVYHRYEFHLEGNHMIMYETIALNI